MGFFILRVISLPADIMVWVSVGHVWSAERCTAQPPLHTKKTPLWIWIKYTNSLIPNPSLYDCDCVRLIVSIKLQTLQAFPENTLFY